MGDEHFRRLKAIVGTLAIISIVVLQIAANGPNAVSHFLHIQPSRAKCDKAAVRQLPHRVVDQVNHVQAQAQLDRNVNYIPLRRPLIRGWQDLAVVSFEARFCGFSGDIRVLTGQGIRDEQIWRDELHDQVLYFDRQGRQIDEPDGAFISNSVPTVRSVSGYLVMTIIVDRVYPLDTWYEDKPRLAPIPFH